MRSPARNLAIAIVLCCVTTSGHGESAFPALDTDQLAHLSLALDYLNMTTNDLCFQKDVAEPRWCLKRVRSLLARPLELPRFGGYLADRAAGIATNWYSLACIVLEDTSTVSRIPEQPVAIDLPAELDPSLSSALQTFFARLDPAHALVDAALSRIDPNERVYAAAAYVGNSFNVEDHPEVRVPLMDMGIPSNVIDSVIASGLSVDPEPAASRQLAVIQGLDLARLLRAADVADRAAKEFISKVAQVSRWPSTPIRIETANGALWIGTAGNDTYDEAALLVVDPAGDDVYRGLAGSANGLQARPLSLVIDCAGDDRYSGEGILAPGAALFGVALIHDAAGNDVYHAAYAGQGAAVFGVARLLDAEGDDTYRAHAIAQGAAYAGAALLIDGSGNDIYDVGFCGQGFAGVRGLGMLVDHTGNDHYHAGGRRPDFDRNDRRYLSLSQGFSIGMRPFAGGGVGALIDLSGSDSYHADVYGQGVGYWYSAGILLDRSGDDTYRVYQYGQGSGIHLSLGLLADGAGHDSYTGSILSQGNAHDYAVGFLLDHGGNDTYSAKQYSQGRAMNTSVGLLFDAGGADSYFATQIDNCQAIGDDGHYREYGSLGLILDLGGGDHYSCGASNGARMTRPSFGIVYDEEE